MLSKLSNTTQILILLGVLVVGLIIGNVIPPINTWFASKPDTGAGNGTGNGTTGGRLRAGLSTTSRSNGCNCVGGSISNYGISSGIPCSNWSRYCSGSPN